VKEFTSGLVRPLAKKRFTTCTLDVGFRVEQSNLTKELFYFSDVIAIRVCP
jgi:hypothetical protein